MPFSRELTKAIIEALKEEPLFRERLLPDIKSGLVFPAIRPNDRICFYYRGWRLFEYTAQMGFVTNVKFGLVLKSSGGRTYVREQDLAQLELESSFLEGYAQIKKNAAELQEPERAGVGDLCELASYAKDEGGEVVVLDVEVGLQGEGTSATDRIDFVLMDKGSSKLTFFEAKRWCNKELFGDPPSVVDQLMRYDGYLVRDGSVVLAQYQKYVEAMSTVLGAPLPMPQSIEPVAKLLVFEYNRNSEADAREHAKGIRAGSVCIGSTGSAGQGTLEKWLAGK